MVTNSRTARAVVLAIGIAGLVTAATGTGVALASARWNAIWSNGTIHQCLDNKTWVTRTLPRGKSCNSHESAFVFNQKGPQGPRGPRGYTGLPGLGASTLSDDAPVSTIVPPSDWHREVVKEATITTSQPGKLLILDATVEGCNVDNNTDAPITYHYAVYVDGVAVPGTYSLQTMTAQPQSTGEMAHLTLAQAALPSVAAGTHTVQIALITGDVSVNHMLSGSGRLFLVATG